MKNTPKGLRLHIGLFGRRNAGKSSLLNAMTRQQVSIVSEVAGTTTDPVEKPMELLPLGPVLFIDTAGIDDAGALGEKRVGKDPAGLRPHRRRPGGGRRRAVGTSSRKRSSANLPAARSRDRRLQQVGPRPARRGGSRPSCKPPRRPGSRRWPPRGEGMLELREALIQAAPEEFLNAPPIVADLVAAGRVGRAGRADRPRSAQGPADPAAGADDPRPAGRRRLLAWSSRSGNCATPWTGCKRPPALVVTDSQAFLKVAGDTPPEVKMTSFSILFARQKGDLAQFVEGAMAIERLRPGDRVLIAEACTHHPIADDIGRVKIPRWLRQYVGGQLDIRTTQGHDFPDDLADYQLVVHCGACMWNRREMLSRHAPLPPGRRADLPTTA